jgi:hypothetical protein
MSNFDDREFVQASSFFFRKVPALLSSPKFEWPFLFIGGIREFVQAGPLFFRKVPTFLAQNLSGLFCSLAAPFYKKANVGNPTVIYRY